MSPAEVKSPHDAAYGLKADTFQVADWTMLVGHDGYVFIAEHPMGEKTKQRITIPRQTFAKLVNWYLRDQSKGATK